MGINANHSDVCSELIWKPTESRREHHEKLREAIKNGKLTVLEYLVKCKGYSEEHALILEPTFKCVILKEMT